MLLNSPRQRNLLPDLRARRRRQLDLRQIGFDGDHTTTSGGRPDVDEQKLILDEFGYFCGFLVFGFYTEETAEKEEGDFEFCVDEVCVSQHNLTR